MSTGVERAANIVAEALVWLILMGVNVALAYFIGKYFGAWMHNEDARWFMYIVSFLVLMYADRIGKK